MQGAGRADLLLIKVPGTRRIRCPVNGYEYFKA